MSTLRDRLDRIRADAHRAIDKLPGKLGDVARRANTALGRPLADATELADRRAFEARATAPATSAAAPRAAREAAPVIVYHMDKTRRDAARLTEVLDGAGIPYKVMNLQEDPAAQAAIRRDSKGFRLPVVFIAGEAIGGRAELTTLAASGDLSRKVFG
ncbi:MAG TPA: glutaredoxin domain-containing protein [Kofleriaceae bacterium]